MSNWINSASKRRMAPRIPIDRIISMVAHPGHAPLFHISLIGDWKPKNRNNVDFNFRRPDYVVGWSRITQGSEETGAKNGSTAFDVFSILVQNPRASRRHLQLQLRVRNIGTVLSMKFGFVCILRRSLREDNMKRCSWSPQIKECGRWHVWSIVASFVPKMSCQRYQWVFTRHWDWFKVKEQRSTETTDGKEETKVSARKFHFNGKEAG